MISRRGFIKQSGVLLSAAGAGLSGFTFAKTKKYKMGLQLFNVRGPMTSDPGELKESHQLTLGGFNR